ncbi:hypothetical protein A9Z06_06485 [Rhizobium sp. YK2]|nr:hypothetical protein A9Z06_06485 [Rhizobium sp. YK2]
MTADLIGEGAAVFLRPQSDRLMGNNGFPVQSVTSYCRAAVGFRDEALQLRITRQILAIRPIANLDEEFFPDCIRIVGDGIWSDDEGTGATDDFAFEIAGQIGRNPRLLASDRNDIDHPPFFQSAPAAFQNRRTIIIGPVGRNVYDFASS